MQETHNPDQTPTQQNQMTITISRDKLMNALVVAELVLLIVFGFQIHDIKQRLASGDQALAQNAPAAQKTPSPAPSQPAEAKTVVDIELREDDHIRGNENAKVTIVEYSDFECPFCGRAHPTVQEVMDTYGDDVRIVYRHFPLSFHPQAQKAAEASECAAEQGKFWEFHDKVFENQTIINGGVRQFKAWAGELGLNQAQFDECLDSGKYTANVKNEFVEGSELGVTGTPAFFINGQQVTGAQPFSVFQQVIDAELAKN